MTDAINNSGVNAGSMPFTYDSYVIFCCGNSIQREAQFKAFAAGHLIGYKALYGRYKGQDERSFIVNLKNWPEVCRFAKDEETILLLHSNENFGGGVKKRPATLMYYGENKNSEDLGYFTETSKELALASDAYTYDPAEDKYWVCKPDTRSKA